MVYFDNEFVQSGGTLDEKKNQYSRMLCKNKLRATFHTVGGGHSIKSLSKMDCKAVISSCCNSSSDSMVAKG